jgi:hypothetical protein
LTHSSSVTNRSGFCSTFIPRTSGGRESSALAAGGDDDYWDPGQARIGSLHAQKGHAIHHPVARELDPKLLARRRSSLPSTTTGAAGSAGSLDSTAPSATGGSASTGSAPALPATGSGTVCAGSAGSAREAGASSARAIGAESAVRGGVSGLAAQAAQTTSKAVISGDRSMDVSMSPRAQSFPAAGFNLSDRAAG